MYAASRPGSFGYAAFSCTAQEHDHGRGRFVTTNDDRLADWIKLYRNQGMRERYHHESSLQLPHD